MLGFAAIAVQPAKAQLNVNINVGSQPNWGPKGYNYVNYYYLPEVDSYYYVPTRKFIYLKNNRWVHSSRLQSKHRHYNLHRGRKIIINENRPYLRHKTYYTRYHKHSQHNRPRQAYYNSNYKKDHKSYKKQEYRSYKGNKHDHKRDKHHKHGRSDRDRD